MDFEDLSSIEFLDLSDVDINEQNRIKTSLQQYDPSVQLPWIKRNKKVPSIGQHSQNEEESIENIDDILINPPIHHNPYVQHTVMSPTLYYNHQQPQVVVQPILTYSHHPTNVVYYANPGAPMSPPYPHVFVPHQTNTYPYPTVPSQLAPVENFDVETQPNGDIDTRVDTVNINTVVVENEAPTPATNSDVVPNGESNISNVSSPAPANKSWASLFNSSKSNSVPVSPANGSAHNYSDPAVNNESNNNVSLCPIKHPRRSQQFVDPDCYRMGEYLTLYNLEGKSLSLQPRGLLNQSNYCYINSILQALIACPPLFNLLSGLAKNISSNEKRKPTPVIDGMCRLVKEFKHLPPAAKPEDRRSFDKNNKKDAGVMINTDLPFEPTWIYKMLNGLRTDLIEGRQEDAEEFLGFLLNGLNDEMLELMKLVKNDTDDPQINHAEIDADDEWQVMGSKNKGSVTRRTDFEKTPIRDIFGGLLRSKIVRSGDLSTENIQPFLTLQLNIEKAKTVREALEALVNKNQLEGLTSSKTNEQVEAWQQVMLDELPVILILHLKCFDFQHDGCTKIIKALEVPVDLKIDSKLISSSKTQTPKERQYKLFAVVYHDGKEATKGHYITDAFHVGYGCWLRYDDASVKTVLEEQVLRPQGTRVPYLLFYRRGDTIRSK
ncbi:unnamed protein product [Phaedon cochleariae]|uniref:ubiquitinyl hydrolase 1 n=1 Tax=Phaedon cochleariae TaxID=80249 RepID=A0A9N9SIR9_PHACE|nr:unnamed protein product [Phaedon cochleariae]